MNIVFILLLLIASFMDVKKREIPDTVCFGIAVISLLNIHLLGIFAALPFLICAMINPNNIGGGDIKLTAAVGLFIGFWNTIYGLIIALSITTIIHVTHNIYIKIKQIFKSEKGEGFPLAIAITLSLIMIFTGVSEYFRLMIVAQGVRDTLQDSVISTVVENYADVYHGTREGYSGGYQPSAEDFQESLNYGDIYGKLLKCAWFGV